MPNSRSPAIVYEQRFRTPLAVEKNLGLWVDRMGRHGSGKPLRHLRVLGQYGIIAIEAGRGFFDQAGQTRCELRAGDAVLLFPETATRHAPHTGGWTHIALIWNGPEGQLLTQAGLLNPRQPVLRGAQPLVSRAWTRLEPLMARDTRSALLERKIIMLELIHGLSLLQAREGDLPRNRETALEQILAELELEQPGHPDLTRLPRRLGISPATCRRLCLRVLGTTPKAYAELRRINRAKARLAEGVPAKAIATELGFYDVFHFIKTFKRLTGLTPGCFRENCGS